MTTEEISKGKVRKTRFDKRDFDLIAEEVVSKLHDRKQRRKHREKVWKEVDRQLRMEPDISFKMTVLPDGSPSDRVDPRKAWLPEVELPLQRQALEVLTADARRMMFPDSGPWFEAHAEVSDTFLEKAEAGAVKIAGDETDQPSLILQDNVDKLIAGRLNHLHRQYEFFGTYDRINGEAFKYGTGVGRGRNVRKQVFLDTARGIVKQDVVIPMLVFRSIKNVYLDDTLHHVMNEGHFVGPGIISEHSIRFTDLIKAANSGSNDPNREDGGWMPNNLTGLDVANEDIVTVAEYEGDLIVPRKTRTSLLLSNVIVTVVIGKTPKGQLQRKTIRLRFNKLPFSSFLIHPYHIEDADDKDNSTPYGEGPLTMGMHVHSSAVQALNVFHQTAQLNAAPPVGYDGADVWFAQRGGPVIEPFAQWATNENIEVHQFGDPAAIFQAFTGFVLMHGDVTGVNAPRLGAQTVSHTTAFAKEAELSRGTVRTVDYVRSMVMGPLPRWLYMEYAMDRANMTGSETFYVDTYQGFLTTTKDAFPENVAFEVFGSGGPQEEQQKIQNRLAAVNQAIQIDAIKIQAGMEPSLDYEQIQKQILRDGGWTDVDTLLRSQDLSQGAAGGPAVQNAPGANPGTAIAALQNIGS